MRLGGVLASRNLLGPPLPRPPAGPVVGSAGGAEEVEEAEAVASGRRAGAELPSISGEPPFMGVISAPV